MISLVFDPQNVDSVPKESAEGGLTSWDHVSRDMKVVDWRPKLTAGAALEKANSLTD